MTTPDKGVLMGKSMDYQIVPKFESDNSGDVKEFKIIDDKGNQYIYAAYEFNESVTERSDAGG